MYSLIFMYLIFPYPSCLEQLAPEVLRWIPKGQFLTSDMIDWRLTAHMKEKVIEKANFLGFLLVPKVDINGYLKTGIASLRDFKRWVLYN